MLGPQQIMHTNTYPKNVGIKALQVYFPKTYVDQTDLEAFDNVSAGKYTIGLGQLKMAVTDDREDINSICLTVVDQLLKNYNISPQQIGRLEVGTETIIDKSKSIKSTLMQLFQHANSDIEGIDTTNACYGATNALFNAVNWVNSPSWDGRMAIVVAADIAVYAPGNARATGGCGAVAMLVGDSAALVFGIERNSHMEHAYDFYKPNLSSEYPVVDGALSNECYGRAVDKCYNGYIKKLTKGKNQEVTVNTIADYFIFHSPYTKLVQKSFARLSWNDNVRNSQLDESVFTRDIEKQYMLSTKPDFDAKVLPSLTLAKNCGNMYCASVYAGLVSLICNDEDLMNKRILLFSYGSGLASSIFSLSVNPSAEITIKQMSENINLDERLALRSRISAQEFNAIMLAREESYGKKSFVPKKGLDGVWDGAWFLTGIDDGWRREYDVKEMKN